MKNPNKISDIQLFSSLERIGTVEDLPVVDFYHGEKRSFSMSATVVPHRLSASMRQWCKSLTWNGHVYV